MSKFLLLKKFCQHFLVLFLLCLFLGFFSPTLEGAYLRNFPVKISQPNGEVLNVFASGDEFYNWLHDKDGYTILRNPKTGYFVYAVKEEGDLLPSIYLVSSSHAVNRLSLYSLNIPKYLKHSPEKIKSPKELFPMGSAADVDSIYSAPQTGTINNLCVFIRFSDEGEFSDAISTYDSMFNNSSAGTNSLSNYFKEVSYNALTVSTTFYPAATTTVVSFQDSLARAYYQPYDESTNPSGYKDETERRIREHTLLKNAIESVRDQVPSGLNLDGDGDGRVDNVCFIVYGGPDGWNELLWPHKWSLYSFNVSINSKRVYTYNFQLQTSLGSSGVGVLCHEMFHSIGAPDLYHYNEPYKDLDPVGKWDIMERNLNPPQHMGAYMKNRYGTWISSIPAITTSGTYTLNPLTSSTNNCYKIVSRFTTDEYFVVEYRKQSGTFESSLPGSGLLVYRINPAYNGNAQGPPDEVYIYRPDGTTTVNGTPDIAHFSSGSGRTGINDSTNPSSFLTNGEFGGLDISNIGAVNGTISFDVTFSTTGPWMLSTQSSPNTGVNVTIAPNDLQGNGAGTTNFSRYYSHNSVVSLSAPSTSGGLDFLKWTVGGADYSTSQAINVTMDGNKTTVAVYGLDLGEAVDNTSLTWTSGGDSMWYGQITVFYNGNDAAQSADIADSQSTYMQTSVFGPGTLSFYWKVSSESSYDYLKFYTGATLSDSISGIQDWAQKTLPISSGVQTLKWVYEKDTFGSEGSDCGYLDKVVFTPDSTVTISGSVKTAASAGVEGVTVTFSNGGGQASTSSSGDYSQTVGTGWSGTATPFKTGGAFTPTSRSYSTITTNQTNQDYTADIPPQISLSRSRLNFGSVIGEGTTNPQNFMVSNSGESTLSWTASSSKGWLSVNPASGTNSGVVTVSVNATGLTVGTYSGTVTIADPNASNSPQALSVAFTVKSDGAAPTGSFDTPTDGTTGVTGSIPVTGWAVDDVGVQSVKIYRDPVAGESTEDPIYIGDAVFVEGARPDVELAYPGYPLNYQAGWGYMMLTNFLPGQGNGSYRLYAIATDMEGQKRTLGTKTIMCDNAHAVKPFGAIDTPTQGGTNSGKFFNAGWALTPMPNTIPKDGSTINVWVDGVPIGHPDYNQFRDDIAALFPGYNNSNGAVGAFLLDTTQYANGVHTIAWSVSDNVGNSDGIGSRFFNISNIGGSASAQREPAHRDENSSMERGYFSQETGTLRIKRGYERSSGSKLVLPETKGTFRLDIKEVERIEVELGEGVKAGYLVVGEELRPLPIGSTLDVEKEIFYWQPGPGFLGEYDFVFFKMDKGKRQNRIRLTIAIKAKEDT